MKFRLSIIFVLLLTLTIFTQAQTTTDILSENKTPYGASYQYSPLSLDSGEVCWSQNFNVTAYDAKSFYTYPVQLTYDLAAADSINLTVYWYGTDADPDVAANWVVIDTLFSTTSATAAIGTANLNGKKKLHNKLKIDNTGSSANTLYFGMYLDERE